MKLTQCSHVLQHVKCQVRLGQLEPFLKSESNSVHYMATIVSHIHFQLVYCLNPFLSICGSLFSSLLILTLLLLLAFIFIYLPSSRRSIRWSKLLLTIQKRSFAKEKRSKDTEGHSTLLRLVLEICIIRIFVHIDHFCQCFISIFSSEWVSE